MAPAGLGSGAGSLCAFHPRILESLPMTQNVISIDIPAELLAKLDAALDAIEAVTDIFEPISEEQMRALAKMGDRLEPFCRLAAAVLPQYPRRCRRRSALPSCSVTWRPSMRCGRGCTASPRPSRRARTP
jgi:hypothetical protein